MRISLSAQNIASPLECWWCSGSLPQAEGLKVLPKEGSRCLGATCCPGTAWELALGHRHCEILATGGEGGMKKWHPPLCAMLRTNVFSIYSKSILLDFSNYGYSEHFPGCILGLL